jgi:hypothetical protein
MIYTLLTWGLAWISRSPHLLAHPGTKRTYGLDRAAFRHITASKGWEKENKLYLTHISFYFLSFFIITQEAEHHQQLGLKNILGFFYTDNIIQKIANGVSFLMKREKVAVRVYAVGRRFKL